MPVRLANLPRVPPAISETFGPVASRDIRYAQAVASMAEDLPQLIDRAVAYTLADAMYYMRARACHSSHYTRAAGWEVLLTALSITPPIFYSRRCTSASDARRTLEGLRDHYKVALADCLDRYAAARILADMAEDPEPLLGDYLPLGPDK